MILRSAVMIVALVLSWPCLGQQTPSVQEIIQKLRPAAEPGERLSLRGLHVEPQSDTSTTSQTPSIDLSVNFEFGSARLTTDALIVLNNLGRALNDGTLQPYRFVVAGHTDGVGRPEINQRLSKARARMVTDYLTRVHGIVRERLVARGFGATQLLDPANPANSLNRRVQVTTLGPNN